MAVPVMCTHLAMLLPGNINADVICHTHIYIYLSHIICYFWQWPWILPCEQESVVMNLVKIVVVVVSQACTGSHHQLSNFTMILKVTMSKR